MSTRTMSTDYRLITEENIRRYGTDIDEYGPVLLSNRYSDRTHFVYELLQNAEDAIGWRLALEDSFPRDVVFELQNNCLLFRHFGQPFNEEHVRGICNIGKGTKRQDLSSIGKHGIGFKSVYAYTHHPEVHSGDEHFVIDSFVRPCKATPRRTANGETRFFLPFDHPDVPQDEAYDEIAGRLQELGLRTLLFLRNIESISWHLACGKKRQYLRDATSVDDGIDRVTLLSQDDTEGEAEEHWLVFRKPIMHEDHPAGFVEVAFQLTHNDKRDEERIAAIAESPLVVYFPTEKETHFGFLIQGPYRTTPSRDNIPRDDAWNKELVKETANVLVWALASIRDQKLMNVDALEALVVDLAKYEVGAQASLFRPIAESIVDNLKCERLIPSFRGGHLRGSASCIARAEGLRKLVSHPQLAEITGSKVGWVTGGITYNRTPELRSFLIESVGVKELDAESFVRDLSEDFLKKQSDNWIADFYTFLLDQQAIRRRPWFSFKPLIRLRTGAHVAAFSNNGRPNAYLPGSGRTTFPTVKKSLCEGDSLRFLTQLGLKPPDVVDDVIRHVLPKYEKDEVDVDDVDDAEYKDDIKQIVDAFATDSKGQRDKLLKALRKTPFVMSVDVGDRAKYVSPPEQLYLATDRLKKLFACVPGVMLVDDNYACLRGEAIREMLEACGVIRHVRPVSDNSLSWHEKCKLREQSGHPETSWQNDRVTDWTLDGLANLLDTLPSLSVKERRVKAELLWEELAHLEQRRGKGVFEGEYTWTHYGDRRAPPFNSAFIRTLNESEWIPDETGELQPPSLILLESLGWKPNPFLQSKIRFKPPIIDALAKEAGVEAGVLDLLKKHGLTSVADLVSRLGIDEDDEEEDDADSEIEDENSELEDECGDDDDDIEDVSDTEDHEDDDEEEDSDDTGNVDDAIRGILGDTSGPSPPVDDPTGPDPMGGGGGTGFGKGGGAGTNGSGGAKSGKKGGKHSGKGKRGKGKPGGKQGGGTKPFISYVATHPDEDESDPDGLVHEARMALEEKAIDLILSREPQLNRTPTHNPGYDLFEGSDDEETLRLVEVKAMTGDLQGRAVGLSRTQFECAQEHSEGYWLYVVEYADDPSRSRIVRIQDPAGKARTFCFDHGWVNVAEVEEPDDESEAGDDT